MTRLVGLYREREYSPGRHQSNDASLLEQVTLRLRARGFSVDLMTLDEARAPGSAALASRPEAAVILSMCQGRAALDLLAALEQHGARIVNSPRAALNTHRDRLPEVMIRADIPYPPTVLVSTDAMLDLLHATINPETRRCSLEVNIWKRSPGNGSA